MIQRLLRRGRREVHEKYSDLKHRMQQLVERIDQAKETRCLLEAARDDVKDHLAKRTLTDREAEVLLSAIDRVLADYQSVERAVRAVRAPSKLYQPGGVQPKGPAGCVGGGGRHRPSL